MPFPRPLTAAELILLRNYGDYRASTNLAYCPQTVVFQAEVATGIVTGVFAEVEFDNVTVGAFGDIQPGMTVYIGATSNIRFATLNTYARKDATSDTLFIGESAVVLQAGDVMTVVADFTLRELLLHINTAGTVLVNWDVTYQAPAPLIGNLQSAYIDPRTSGAATLTFSPTGIPMTYGATITAWLWDVADGTITVGSSSTQRITATFPQGERWIHVTVTDSNGVSHTRHSWINVGLTYTIQNIGSPPITDSLADGWNLSLETWDFQGATILRSLPENTLCVVYTAEIFGDGSSTPLVTNIDFIGRTRGESSNTVGDEEWSTLQTGGLEMEGFGSQLNRLSSPQLSIAHSTSPAAWGQVNRPTVPRFIGHLGTYFNTLWGLCSPYFNIPFTYIASTTNADATVTVTDTSILIAGMGVSGTGIPGGTTIDSITNKTTFELSANATATGTPTLTFTPEYSDNRFISTSLTITETSAGAALDRIAKWINAGLDYAASGEIDIRRHAFYLDAVEKTQLKTLVNITGGDYQEYTLDIEYPDLVGRAFTGAEFFSTSLNATRYITGSAPPVARGNGEGQATEDGQILTADTTEGDNITELNVRTAGLYADSQPKDKIDILFYDAWRGYFVASRSRWLTMTLLAASNIMGRLYTSTQRWICTAVSYNLLLETGEIANRATLILEPVTGSAQVASAISPAIVEPALPDLPAFNPYPGMELEGSINYPVDEPTLDDLQPIDSYSDSYGNEEVAQNYPPPGCRAFSILMNDSVGVTTPTLMNAAIYTVRSSGVGQIADGGWSQTGIDFEASEQDFAPVVTSADLAVYSSGDGFTRVYDVTGSGDSETRIFRAFADTTTFNRVRVRVTCNTEFSFAVFSSSGAVNSSTFPAKTDEWIELAAVFTDDYLRLDLFAADGDFTLTFHELEAFGTGINPFTGSPGSGLVNADSYYYFDPANESVGYPYTGYGLTFDGAAPDYLPPYNTNHVYESTITGAGAGVDVKFSDTDYGDNAASTINVRICGDGL